MTRISIAVLALVLAVMTCAGGGARAQGFSGLARVDMAGSQIVDASGAISVALTLSQGVPWRVFTLDGPPRAVFDFREVDWTGVSRTALLNADAATDLRFGAFRPGWSRLVVDLAAPQVLERAAMKVDEASGRAVLTARFVPASAERFAARSGMPEETPEWTPGEGLKAPERGSGPMVVVIDPGHGGIDPGAERGGLVEKDLMLTFARELEEALVRAGGTTVVLTRTDDSFVSLERRVEIAHEAQAHVFLSLHADVIPEGHARGVAIYRLSETATDEASARLAERHDRDDLLSGIDLTGKDDVVADVLMDLARMETRPRTTRLAAALEASFAAEGLRLHTRPQRSAGFSVLKAPDIPSLLLELGFLSDERDRANLSDPAWRARMAASVRDGLQAWAIEDAALAKLVRQ